MKDYQKYREIAALVCDAIDTAASCTDDATVRWLKDIKDVWMKDPDVRQEAFRMRQFQLAGNIDGGNNGR